MHDVKKTAVAPPARLPEPADGAPEPTDMGRAAGGGTAAARRTKFVVAAEGVAAEPGASEACIASAPAPAFLAH